MDHRPKVDSLASIVACILEVAAAKSAVASYPNCLDDLYTAPELRSDRPCTLDAGRAEKEKKAEHKLNTLGTQAYNTKLILCFYLLDHRDMDAAGNSAAGHLGTADSDRAPS